MRLIFLIFFILLDVIDYSFAQGGLVGGGNQVYIPKETLYPNWLNK